MQIFLSANGDGGVAQLVDKSGEATVKIYADERENGVVGAYNRKGEGKVIKPGHDALAAQLSPASMKVNPYMYKTKRGPDQWPTQGHLLEPFVTLNYSIER